MLFHDICWPVYFKFATRGCDRKGSFENEALENEDQSTKHPNLEKKPVCPLKTQDSPLSSHQQQESCTITNRMQFKTIQLELRGVANAFPTPRLLAISELRRTLGRVSDLSYR